MRQINADLAGVRTMASDQWRMEVPVSFAPIFYGWLTVAAFAFFLICLGSISEMTEAHLRAQNKKGRRS